MAEALHFADVLEAAELLSEDEHATLLDILEKRLAERRRHEIAAEVNAARLEHEGGESRPASPDELMDEILS